VTPDQIRTDAEGLDKRASRYDDMGRLGPEGDIQLAQARYLGEIAAQFAELNEQLRQMVKADFAEALRMLERKP
jgi:hypothetical protein